jgi:hypothetical protein
MVRAISLSLTILIATILVDSTVKCSGVRTFSQKYHDKNKIEKKQARKLQFEQIDEITSQIEEALETFEALNDTITTVENTLSDFGVEVEVDDILAGSLCFSAYNDVEVQGKGMVPMNSVKVGDYVRVFRSSSRRSNNDDSDYSRVFSLAHLDHNYEANFLQLHYDVHTEGNGAKLLNKAPKPLEITGRHMVYVVGKGVIRADEVKVGDELQLNLHLDTSSDENPIRISKMMALVNEIGSVKRKGVYAPVTETGDLIVSGVRASSYYAFFDGVPSNAQHALTHLFFAPHRILCSNYDFGLCENEMHTDGYTNWAYWAIRIMEITNKVVVWTSAQCILALLSFPFLLAGFILEKVIVMIMNPFTTTTMTLVTIPFAYSAIMLNTKAKDNAMMSNH